MGKATRFLIFEVSDEELGLLCAVRDTGFSGNASEETIDRALQRGLIDRVAGSYGGFALATPGRHTLWRHERPKDLTDEPWERCEGCGSTHLMVVGAWQADGPIRANCQDCGVSWVRA